MQTWKSSLAISAIALSIALPAGAQPMPVAFGGASFQNSGIQYLTGGFGLDDRAEMQRVAGVYNVLVMFAEPNGEFVVTDSVTVKKGNVEVLQVSDAGPLLYMNLPYGTYTVHANYNGVPRSRTINVGRRTPDVVMTWPAGFN